MAQNQISNVVDRTWWALVIRGMLAIAIGIIIIARPLESVAAFALVIALWALMQGVVSIVHAFDLRSVAPRWWVLMLSGIVGVLFGGAALYYYPGLSLSFAVVWTSWWLILGGVLGIYLAVQERSAGLSWGWTMTLGVLGVVAGIAAFAYPPATLAALMAFISVFAIAGGVVQLVGAYKLRSAQDEVRGTLGIASRS
jgi:uncharacterized membrane protein HdeD (DUF308 family)